MCPRLLAFALLFAACNDSQPAGSSPDLSVAPAPDLAVAPMPDLAVADDLAEPGDLAVPPDLSGPDFCRGTAIGGTCVQRFFAPVTACFDTTGGCTVQQRDFQYDICWPSGAHLEAIQDQNSPTFNMTWYRRDVPCMTAVKMVMKGGGATYEIMVNGSTLTLDTVGAQARCPDGTVVQFGIAWGGCDALQTLLETNTKNCAMGTCP